MDLNSLIFSFISGKECIKIDRSVLPNERGDFGLFNIFVKL